jgi:hypothetical protein
MAMTEDDWLEACADPRAMLDHLDGTASSRDLRLFGCAVARRMGLRPEWIPAIEEVERPTPGRATPDKVIAARRELNAVAHGLAFYEFDRWVGYLPALVVMGERFGIQEAKAIVNQYAPYVSELQSAAVAAAVLRPLAYILRDIFGNPFRPVALDPACLSWNHGIVPAIAQRIYDDRTFHNLPILAAVLEDFGCADQDILAHCRLVGMHVRGCWVIKLLLGNPPEPATVGESSP